MVYSGEERRNVKAAIYIRVSTEEQAKEGISLAAQEERAKAFCVAKGWGVFKVYRDRGFSAGSMKRPALKQLMNDAEAKKYRVVVVYKIDRFSRQLKDLILTLDELRQHAINFSSVTEQIDTTTAMGVAFFQMIGIFAQLERGMVKERVEMAFDKKINAGEALNRAPMGYFYKGRKLMVNDTEAEKVREIFQMWASGVNYKEIAKKFELPTSTLYEIVKNPTYIGKVKYRDSLYKGVHNAIIDEALFERINGKNK